MAVYTGKAMVVTFGSALTHVRSAKVSPSIDQVEITAAADTAKTYVTTTTGFDCTMIRLSCLIRNWPWVPRVLLSCSLRERALGLSRFLELRLLLRLSLAVLMTVRLRRP